ncbi:MAG TPA: EAL domain-containing protein [Rickettsiales bacterium]|nr:EAL domain-containing protein [Rickettsiales bacterium]
MDAALNILIIEDNEGDAFLIREMLEQEAPHTFSIQHSPTLEEAEPQYKNKPFNLLLLDLNLPGITGMEAIEKLRRDLPGVPIIVMTGLDDDKRALGALQRGAQDYIVKGQYGNKILPRAIRYAIERKQFESKVIELAHFDRVTGLINRNLFMERLESRLAGQPDSPLAVLLLSLRRFKEVTATLGPEMGQALLKAVGVRLSERITQQDAVARMEGDEFAILVTGQSALPAELAKLSGQLLKVVERPFEINGLALHIGASIGIAIYPACGSDKNTLITHADSALHRARQNADSTFEFYTSALNEELSQRVLLERDLRTAIQQRQLLNYYQPIIDLKTAKPCGVETLVRWQHPERGMIPPLAFIPLAEKSGLITEVSDYVIRQACEDAVLWQGIQEQPIYIALNLASRDFQQEGFSRHLQEILRRAGIDPKHIALEVTEGTLMENPKQAIQTLTLCRELGASVFIDDFGTGYSSLSYLSQLPLDILKIDRSFVADILTNGHNLLIASATINLAHALNLKVVAEGIETQEQKELLKALGCDKGQGYYFARPMPKEELAAWLKAQQ